MKAIFAAIGLACAVPCAAFAQLATLDAVGGSPPIEGVAGMPGGSSAEPLADATATPRACEEQARAFHARNTQSPSRRQQALEECLAAAARGERVEVAGP